MGVRKRRNPPDALAEKVFPTVLRKAAVKPQQYPFLKRSLRTSALPKSRDVPKEMDWEHDLFLSKRASEEAHLEAGRSDRELVLNIRSAWLVNGKDPEARKFAITANVRIEVHLYTNDDYTSESPTDDKHYVAAYSGQSTWLSDGSFRNNPGDIKIGSSSRWKRDKGQSLAWLAIRSEEDTEDMEDAGDPEVMDTQDSQTESQATWKQGLNVPLVVVTQSGSLASPGDTVVELWNHRHPEMTMLVDLNLEWKTNHLRHLKPMKPVVRRSINHGLAEIGLIDEDKPHEPEVWDAWACPLCIPFKDAWSSPLSIPPNYGSWGRLQAHIEREHPESSARREKLTKMVHGRRVDMILVIGKRQIEEEVLPGTQVLTSTRMTPGTLADRLYELDTYYRGGDLDHLVQEREALIFDWEHFTGKRSYLMCMWNRWVAEKGPLLIHTGRKYTCDWVERYRPLFLKYDLAAELRDHLMILVEYRIIDSLTMLAAMRKLKDLKGKKRAYPAS